ncbi:Bug family tripartite tricarboxylate transporter substrate binding protein [Advenella mimigardefordensis]|uniref:Putative Bug-like extracytoplasmic solute binding receptor, TTT family n=1 Tax=Advenella mimigardefordensis (strain DSM 17166 / LMG 22922 / DPN7) TaxID=1247726 RepID=W0PB58_ADVMD|nr:tripartite tricarboxylate transporter substrate binding protein [Advenella mimigardefordensis]AHG62702.1 putative Bug-like extracytoplasmic solute binding receptor, TTT family [Advenella mimigardefordensis DPN7]
MSGFRKKYTKYMVPFAAALCLSVGQQVAAAPPVNVVVAFPAGGPGDTLARVTGKELESQLKTPVVVENKPGGNGAIAASTVTRARPDGNTLFLSSTGAIAVNPALYKKLIYDPAKDLQPVALLVSTPEVLVVSRKSGITSVKALLEKAKTDPNGISLSTSGVGSMPHMAIAQFRIATQANTLIVPFGGAAPAITATIGGQVDGFFGDVSGLVQHIKDGSLVPIGVASDKRSAALPDVPTFDELGIKNVHATNWYGVFAPTGTPEEKIRELNTAYRAVMKTPAVQKYVQTSGLDTGDLDPAQFGTLIKEDTQKWGALIKQENIRMNE